MLSLLDPASLHNRLAVTAFHPPVLPDGSPSLTQPLSYPPVQLRPISGLPTA
jgi:hypothetical protein